MAMRYSQTCVAVAMVVAAVLRPCQGDGTPAPSPSLRGAGSPAGSAAENATAQLSNERCAQFQVAFSLFDHDGDHKISLAELSAEEHSMGENLTGVELNRMIHQADADGDGYLTLLEFCVPMAALEEQRKEYFDHFDADGDGVMSVAEVRSMVADLGKMLTVKDVDEMIHAADANGDGQLNYEELMRAMPSFLGESRGPAGELRLAENSTVTPAGEMGPAGPAGGHMTEELLGATGCFRRCYMCCVPRRKVCSTVCR